VNVPAPRRLLAHSPGITKAEEAGACRCLPFAQSGGQLLFYLISQLYERTSALLGSPDQSLRHHRNRKRQLALRKPDQLRRRERYRQNSRQEEVNFGRQLISGKKQNALVAQLSESRMDPREDRSLSELGKDPIGLGQMLDGEGAVSLAFIEKTQDHFSPTDMVAINLKLRVAPNLGNK
jgi:hypothetical protein